MSTSSPENSSHDSTRPYGSVLPPSGAEPLNIDGGSSNSGAVQRTPQAVNLSIEDTVAAPPVSAAAYQAARARLDSHAPHSEDEVVLSWAVSRGVAPSVPSRKPWPEAYDVKHSSAINLRPDALRKQWRSVEGNNVPVITFYSHEHGSYRCFSNFFKTSPYFFRIPAFIVEASQMPAAHPRTIMVTRAETTIMACKAALFCDWPTFTRILQEEDPTEIKALGRSVVGFDEHIWQNYVCGIALAIVAAKVGADPEIANLLLSTKDAFLAEAAPRDSLWGVALRADDARIASPSTWEGANLLGWALMECRRRLVAKRRRSEDTPAITVSSSPSASYHEGAPEDTPNLEDVWAATDKWEAAVAMSAAFEADAPQAEDSILADVTADTALALPVVSLNLGNSLVFMMVLSTLSELCILVTSVATCVTGFNRDEKMDRGSAVLVADRAMQRASNKSVHTFLLGESDERRQTEDASSADLVVCAPIDFAVAPGAVVRSPEQLQETRRLHARTKTLHGLFWCTLAALVGSDLHPYAQQAAFTCSSFVRPTRDLQQQQMVSGSGLSAFTLLRVGAGTMQSFLRSPIAAGSEACPASRLHEITEQSLAMQRAMLSWDSGDTLADAAVRGWGAVWRPTDYSKLPRDLLSRVPSFKDVALATLPFSNPCPIVTTEWLGPVEPPTPQTLDITDPLPNDWQRIREAWSVSEILRPYAVEWIREWLNAFLEDLKRVAAGSVRAFNRILVIGQNDFHPVARGVIWDFRNFSKSGGTLPIVPIETYIPSGQLNHVFLEQHLPADFGDQGLVSDIRYGVRFRCSKTLPLQLVLVPHLVDVKENFASFQSELRRLSTLGWYSFFRLIPFMPGRFHMNGLVERKYEPNRLRRKTDAGTPRKEIYDSGGVKCPSLNDAITAEDLINQANGKPANSPYECKSMVHHVAHDQSVLSYLARLLKELLVGSSDDYKDFFNHLKLAPEEYWKACLMTLSQSGDAIYSGVTELAFVVEEVLGFGYRMASDIAQRLADAILVLVRKFMDELEAPLLAADPRPMLQQWLGTRRSLPNGAAEARRYFVHQYTDDLIQMCVGLRCQTNFEIAWDKVITGMNFIMALPIKRQIGTFLRWMGVNFYTAIGLITVPEEKATRAIVGIDDCISGVCVVVERYHSLVGQLQHLVRILGLARDAMYSLYSPFQVGGAAEQGPHAPVVFNNFMKSKLHAFKVALLSWSGAPITWALPDDMRPVMHRHLSHSQAFAIYTDAARSFGLGGWLHGYYFCCGLTARQLAMPIGILELLAVAVAFMVFFKLLKNARNILVRTDSQPIPLVLACARARRQTMQYLHERMKNQYASIAQYIDSAHLYGPMNFLADRASRNKLDELYQFCAQLRVRATPLAVPAEATQLIQDVEAHYYRHLAPAQTPPASAPPSPPDSAPPSPPSSPRLSPVIVCRTELERLPPFSPPHSPPPPSPNETWQAALAKRWNKLWHILHGNGTTMHDVQFIMTMNDYVLDGLVQCKALQHRFFVLRQHADFMRRSIVASQERDSQVTKSIKQFIGYFLDTPATILGYDPHDEVIYNQILRGFVGAQTCLSDLHALLIPELCTCDAFQAVISDLRYYFDGVETIRHAESVDYLTSVVLFAHEALSRLLSKMQQENTLVLQLEVDMQDLRNKGKKLMYELIGPLIRFRDFVTHTGAAWAQLGGVPAPGFCLREPFTHTRYNEWLRFTKPMGAAAGPSMLISHYLQPPIAVQNLDTRISSRTCSVVRQLPYAWMGRFTIQSCVARRDESMISYPFQYCADKDIVWHNVLTIDPVPCLVMQAALHAMHDPLVEGSAQDLQEARTRSFLQRAVHNPLAAIHALQSASQRTDVSSLYKRACGHADDVTPTTLRELLVSLDVRLSESAAEELIRSLNVELATRHAVRWPQSGGPVKRIRRPNVLEFDVFCQMLDTDYLRDARLHSYFLLPPHRDGDIDATLLRMTHTTWDDPVPGIVRRPKRYDHVGWHTVVRTGVEHEQYGIAFNLSKHSCDYNNFPLRQAHVRGDNALLATGGEACAIARTVNGYEPTGVNFPAPSARHVPIGWIWRDDVISPPSSPPAPIPHPRARSAPVALRGRPASAMRRVLSWLCAFSLPCLASAGPFPYGVESVQFVRLDAASADAVFRDPKKIVVRSHQSIAATAADERGAYYGERAAAVCEDVLQNFAGNKTALRPFLQKAVEHSVAGRKPNTAYAEDGHMNKYWIPFARKMGMPVWLRTPTSADDVMFQKWIFSAFLQFVSERMEPRSSVDTAAKPFSAMNVLRNVVRVLERFGEKLVPLDTANATLDGLLMEHVRLHGALSLAVKRKQGLTNELIDGLHATPNGFELQQAPLDWASLTGVSLRAAFNLLSDTGMRNEVNHKGRSSLTLSHVSYFLNGKLYAGPLPGYRMKRGDYAVVVPGVSKNDPWLQNFAGDAIWLEWLPGVRCTADALYTMDLARAVDVDSRSAAPLFVMSGGSMMTAEWLSNTLYRMLVRQVGPAHAKHFSVHSFRIFCATALRKAGASHAIIKSLVRWKNDQSVDLYGKLLPSDFAAWHRKMKRQRVQVLQTSQLRDAAMPIREPTFLATADGAVAQPRPATGAPAVAQPRPVAGAPARQRAAARTDARDKVPPGWTELSRTLPSGRVYKIYAPPAHLGVPRASSRVAAWRLHEGAAHAEDGDASIGAAPAAPAAAPAAPARGVRPARPLPPATATAALDVFEWRAGACGVRGCSLEQFHFGPCSNEAPRKRPRPAY